MCPLLTFKNIMEEDNFHDPGIKHKRVVVNKYFHDLCYKDTGSLTHFKK